MSESRYFEMASQTHDPARPRTLAEKVWEDHVVVSGGGDRLLT